MVDHLTPDQRSAVMARISGKNTKPELLVRMLLHGAGYRYRLHVKSLPGTPDIVFRKRKKAIFVHGCFWHSHAGCKRATIPKTREDFWRSKLSNNARRDQVAMERLVSEGWDVLVVWECALKRFDETALLLFRFMERSHAGGTVTETQL